MSGIFQDTAGVVEGITHQLAEEAVTLPLSTVYGWQDICHYHPCPATVAKPEKMEKTVNTLLDKDLLLQGGPECIVSYGIMPPGSTV